MNPPPLWNVEAEEAVLGSCLIDPAATGRVAAFLSPSDFYREKHKWIFDALLMLAASDTPPDTLTVADELGKAGVLDKAGGMAELSRLALEVPTALHVEYYGRMVERCAVLRRLTAAAEQVARMAHEDTRELGEVLTAAESVIFSVGQRRANIAAPVTTGELGAGAIDRYANIRLGLHHPGVPSYLPDLDKLLVGSGFQPTTLTLIAARPGMGKSSLMGHTALRQAEAGYRVLIFSLEMSRQTLYDRFVSTMAAVDLRRLQSGPLYDDDFESITIAVERLREGDETAAGRSRLGEIIIADQRGLSPFEMQGVMVREAQRRGPVDIVYVDHFQEVGETGIGRKEYSKADVGAAQVRALRNLAGLYNVPVVLLAQLNRQCEGRQDKRPILSDLKDTGALEESADNVIFIYRDDVYDKHTPTPGIAELLMRKQRNGPVGTVNVRFDAPHGRWLHLETYTPDNEQRQYRNGREKEMVF